jgi:FG-GAP-like repeat
LKKKSTSQSAPARRSFLTRRSLARRPVSEGGFFNLRVLIASLFCLVGIFMVLIAGGIYSDSAKAQGTTPAQPGSDLPALVRMTGPARLDQDLRSLPYIPPSEEIEERRLTRHPPPETGEPPPISGFARFQSLLEGVLAPVPAMPGPVLTFDGTNAAQSGCGCLPPDSDGDVGLNHYVNVVNSSIKIFDKSGNPLNGTNGTTFNSFFAPLGNSTPCGTGQNKGDPFVLYDHLAHRWVVSDFAFPSFPGNSFWECIGVSQTDDPTGAWFLYALQVEPANPARLGDYPKLAMWNSGGNPAQNAYFLTVNLFTNNTTFNGVRAFALDRASMLTGGPANAIPFTIDATTLGDAYSLVPASFRTGSAPPAGTDEFLLAIDSPLNGGVTLTKVKGWKFHVDFDNPANSTLGVGPGPNHAPHAPNDQITVNGFVDAFTNTTTNLVPQQGTIERLDTLGDKIMTPVVYQNRNGTESLWASHTVCTDQNCTGPTAVRWYQFSVTGGNFPATPVQQQSWTNGNDGLWRWMPSIAADQNGNVAIGYSTSSPAQFPSIRYAGRLAIDALNNLPQGEAIMTVGGGAQTSPQNRWGDYSMTTVDPSDNKTFWYVNEYFPATADASWFTRIGRFNFPTGAVPPNLPNTDFNHDGKPDILLYAPTTRQTAIWYMNNNAFLFGAYCPTLPAGWNVIDVADFNGDGNLDYALFNASTRQSAIWYLSGVTFITGVYGPTLPSGWQLVGAADFNANGKPDYVLYNASTRQTAIWYMNNNVFLIGAYGPTLPAGWSLAGVADFDGDGERDYLLLNASTRQSAIWYLSGVTFLSAAYGPTIASGYQLQGTADFNGDGKPDYLLFSPSTRRTAIWYLNNNIFLSGAYGPTVPTGWNLVAP